MAFRWSNKRRIFVIIPIILTLIGGYFTLQDRAEDRKLHLEDQQIIIHNLDIIVENQRVLMRNQEDMLENRSDAIIRDINTELIENYSDLHGNNSVNPITGLPN